MNKEAPKALLPNYYRDCDIPCIYVSNEWGIEIKHMVGEERKTAVRENYAVSLITNTIPMCLRYEPYVINNTILVVTHCVDNSWFVWNNPPKGRDYDSRCKKIAWGIAAYIGFHCWIGDDGELDWKHGTIEDLYKAYHDEAIQLLKLMDIRCCRAERHNDTSTMQRIGKEIEEQHRQQEETFIEQSKEVASILGTAVYDTAKGYIGWMEEQNKPQQEQKNLLPEGLRSDEATAYFNKAIELGLMDDEYQWKKGLQLLSCFAREMSLKLKLGKGGRISWKPFEQLFKQQKGKLRLNYNDIQKTGQEPSDVYLIDEVFG